MRAVNAAGAGGASNIATATPAAAPKPLEIKLEAEAKTVGEGGSIEITATANQDVASITEVMLMLDASSTADDKDYSLTPAMLSIPADRDSAMVTLTATDDDLMEGDETLVLTGKLSETSGKGTVMGNVTITIEDGDGITSKSQDDIDAAVAAAIAAAAGDDESWTSEDGPATVSLSDLFNNLPASVNADAMSDDTGIATAGVSGTSVILTPVGAGTADVTVTVEGVPAAVSATFNVTVNRVVVPGVDTTGRVTAFSITGAVEKTIDGVKRMHVIEGTETSVSVEITWTNQQLTALWAGVPAGGKPDPAHGYIYLGWYTGQLPSWLSNAEMNQNPGDNIYGGLDIVLASRQVLVAIPAAPKTNKNSTHITVKATGSTPDIVPPRR